MMKIQLQWEKEDSFRGENVHVLCGCDEAGRGPLAGPVYAAAVILPRTFSLDGLNDSKKLTPARRDLLFDRIRAEAEDWCIARAEVEEIEEMNILNAALLAMRRAVEGLRSLPDAALIDGNVARGFPVPAFSVVHGDALCPSIAAAPVLAKVARDRYCAELDAAYPGYGFAVHKGYGTKAHYAALEKLGPCPAHRMSFLRSFFEKHTDH